MRTEAFVALVGLAGCRIYFDPLTDAGASGNGDSAIADQRGDTPAAYRADIEAESGLVTAPFSFMTAGPETFVVDGNTTGTNGGGSVSFNVVVPRAGTYYLWGRVLAPDANTDSFFVELGGTGAGLFVTSECAFSASWHWAPVRGGTCPSLSGPRGFVLAAGDNSLDLTSSEGGSKLDRMILTDDPTFVATD